MNSEIIYCGKVENIFKNIADLKKEKIFFLCDSKVYDLYEKYILSAFPENTFVWHNGSGEDMKSWETFHNIENEMLKDGILRNHLIITLGGGAMSDLGGFLAATVKRGVDWINIPTTVLSAVDAGIGGKVGLNNQYGKNQVGAFYFPQKVFLCSEFFNSLDKREVESGLGEVLKYCLLDEEIENLVLNNGFNDHVLKVCAEFKQKIVAQDPLDKNIRKQLNLGHTFGHAFESLWQLPHGIAVVKGIQCLDAVYHQHQYRNKIERLMKALHLEVPQFKKPDWESLAPFLMQDKKRERLDYLSLVTLNKDMPIQHLSAADLQDRFENADF
jgi:3-dehydroquinate synthase